MDLRLKIFKDLYFEILLLENICTGIVIQNDNENMEL